MQINQRYGPWALLVGGSEGMGEHLALRLGAQGVNIVLVARKPEPLAETAQKVRDATGVEVRTLQLDIARDDMLARIREVTDGLQIGLLVHNVSGGQTFGAFIDGPLDTALTMVQANPVAAVKLVHHFGRPMAERGHGGILFFGSFAGVVGSYFLAAYSAAKAFNQVFTEALWAELKPRGVDVLTYLVGLTDTPSYRRSGATDRNAAPVADPADVAQQALDQLAGGPLGYGQENADYFQALSAMGRGEAALRKREMMSRNHPDRT